jgi:hypothetical protein
LSGKGQQESRDGFGVHKKDASTYVRERDSVWKRTWWEAGDNSSQETVKAKTKVMFVKVTGEEVSDIGVDVIIVYGRLHCARVCRVGGWVYVMFALLFNFGSWVSICFVCKRMYVNTGQNHKQKQKQNIYNICHTYILTQYGTDILETKHTHTHTHTHTQIVRLPEIHTKSFEQIGTVSRCCRRGCVTSPEPQSTAGNDAKPRSNQLCSGITM